MTSCVLYIAEGCLSINLHPPVVRAQTEIEDSGTELGSGALDKMSALEGGWSLVMENRT